MPKVHCVQSSRLDSIDSWRTANQTTMLRVHLTLALANHTKKLQAQPQDNNSDASSVVIVIKDDEADGIMDMLERGDSIYNLTQACLLKMRVG